MEHKDRRIFERFPTSISLRYLDLDAHYAGLAQTTDISAGGIGLVTDVKLYKNTPLDLWLNVPDKGEPLHTKGQVLWSDMVAQNSYRVGIRLNRIDLMGMSRVLRTIDMRQKSYR